MEYSPPPLFKQGASARAKMMFFSLLALILLVADSRLQSLATIRQTIGTALYPLQVAALMPRDAAYMVGGYFSSLSALQRENQYLKKQRVANAQELQQLQLLETENAHLRRLLNATQRLPVPSIMSDILYDARDAFSRKIVLDRGSQHGVVPGQPVIDDAGVVGQVTRVFPFTSEVSLLTDKDQAIPVQVVRSGLRSIVYGQGHSGALDLRFMPSNADIQNGDILVTSGIDGLYPAGLAVAKVVQVETRSSEAFARIICEPLAGINRNRQLLILLANTDMPLHPENGAHANKLPPAPAVGAKDQTTSATSKPEATSTAPEKPKTTEKPPTPAKPAPAATAASTAPAAPAAPKKEPAQ